MTLSAYIFAALSTPKGIKYPSENYPLNYNIIAPIDSHTFQSLIRVLANGPSTGVGEKAGTKKEIDSTALDGTSSSDVLHWAAWFLRAVVYLIVGIAMAQCQATARSYSTPRLRDHAKHEESSLEHEFVYKFMIMTSLLHISVTYHVLLSFCATTAVAVVSGLCARLYTPTFHAVCFLPFAALYVVCAQRDDDPRFCIYIQPFVIVCKAAARTCHARFCRIGRNATSCTVCPGITARRENA